MVAKITIPKSIEAALNYNEKKVQKGNAVCLHAENYLNEANRMNFYQKLDGFQRLNMMNHRATTKTLHVSLNFDLTETLPNQKLIDIATTYMNKIGFGEQPFLVYKHEDAGHPHIHIVSTTIKADGSRINTHNIGRNQSEVARKEIEQQFSLIKANHRESVSGNHINIEAEKVEYGKHATKNAIGRVVIMVFDQYKFTSLAEFNAALRQFNVVADKGKEDGRIYKFGGLVYRVLDANGNKTGVPIKASTISCKPTLAYLDKKFEANQNPKDQLKAITKEIIEECLGKKPKNLMEFIDMLNRLRIFTILRKNTEGRIYGITFVDNQHKCVFNGSDLGKAYSIAGIQNRLNSTDHKEPSLVQGQNDIPHEYSGKRPSKYLKPGIEIHTVNKQKGFLTILTDVKEQFNNVPAGLLKKKRKKKNKKQ